MKTFDISDKNAELTVYCIEYDSEELDVEYWKEEEFYNRYWNSLIDGEAWSCERFCQGVFNDEDLEGKSVAVVIDDNITSIVTTDENLFNEIVDKIEEKIHNIPNYALETLASMDLY